MQPAHIHHVKEAQRIAIQLWKLLGFPMTKSNLSPCITPQVNGVSVQQQQAKVLFHPSVSL